MTKYPGKANGGKARMALLTDEQRSENSRMAANKRWTTSTIKAVCSGELKLGNLEIPCHVLDDESRVISGQGFQRSLGFNAKASGMALNQFVANKILPYLSDEVRLKFTNPIEFIRVGSGGSVPKTFGYDVTLMIDICDAIINARNDNVLTPAQLVYAKSAEIIIRSVAKVGVIALVDEATGYQKERAANALSKILEAFVSKELMPWVSTFPMEFYQELFRIRGLPFPSSNIKRPQYFGHITNDLIYKRLAPGVLEELKAVSRKNLLGLPKDKLFQRLSANIGYPKLVSHIGKATMLMKMCKNYEDLKTHLPKYLPYPTNQLSLDLGDYNILKDDGVGL